MASQKSLIFLGGVHGVGKSTLCNSLSQHFNFDYISASSIIKHTKTSKQIKNIGKNQNILILGLNNYTRKKPTILLDGHFCLLDTNNEILTVPLKTFEQLSPKALLLLTTSADVISERLKSRDKNSFTTNFIESFQQREIEQAEFVSKNLEIPLFHLDGNSAVVANDLKGVFEDG